MNDGNLNPSREESAPHLEELADLGLLERTGAHGYKVTPDCHERAEELNYPYEDVLSEDTKALIENSPSEVEFYRALAESSDEE